MFLYHILSALILLYFVNGAEINVANTQLWGPGLRAEANVPVRYFYIQAYDKKNKIIKKDLGDDAFKLSLSSPSGQRVRAWAQVLNRLNGSYVARFRLYDFSGELTISLTHKGKHVANSPYHLKEVYGNDCFCPTNQKKWFKALECPKSFQQIEDDFQIHDKIEVSTLREKMLERFGKHHSFCNYVIKNNEVFRECHGSITDFKMFMDAPLLNLARKVKLPDISFFINLGDWPLEKNKANPLPIVSWCGSDDSYDIILPTYDITNSVLEMLGRVSLDVFSVQANSKPKWSEKEDKGFFRGRDSRQERLDLAAMSLKNPEILEAGITRYFFFKKDEVKYGKPVQHVSFYDFFKYKYQINVDGTVAAYRFPYLMLGNSAVFKQDSGYYEHFYKQLEPNKHYIPIKHDLTDVIEKLKWARANDDKVREIQEAGTKLAREILTPANILCYHVALFNAYAAKQNGTVEVLEGMEKLDQPEQKSCRCRRKNKNKAKDEL
uniref:KDEL motif-containing protein 1 n=1 Tax=Phallusia mammillata TaxID=59560 RepID=A0A6F9DGC5_9ASCI|nr:KDEL motif-containing protein 1 [Phallusia mammillata]